MGVFEFMGSDFDPKGKHIIDTRIVYVLKIIQATGEIDKYKARLVARGFRQIPGVDFDETYSPATMLPVIRIFFVCCLYLGLKVHHMDVKGAFLQSPLTDYDIYIRLPAGYKAFGGASFAKLKKSMYGLKQAARDWYSYQHKFLLSQGYRCSTLDRCMYYYDKDGIRSLVYVHVDDYLIACNDDAWYENLLHNYRSYLNCYETDCDDLGKPLNHMQIALDYQFDKGTVSFSSDRYILETLNRFGLQDSNPKYSPLPRNFYDLPFGLASTCEDTYRSMIGCLMWIARIHRIDIMFAVTYMSQFVACSTEVHLTACKQILKYLRTTLGRQFTYSRDDMRDFVGEEDFNQKIFNITIKCDSDFASDTTDHKSYSGFLIYLNGCLVDWVTRKQSLTATSTSEAEYISLSEACKSGLHVYQLLSEFFKVASPMIVLNDSQSAQAMAENNLSSRRTKHIWIVYRFVTDWINKGLFKIFHIDTKDNLSDYMTKVPKDVNFIRRTALLFKSLSTLLSEVVCYNTTLDPESKLPRRTEGAAGITIRDAMTTVAPRDECLYD